MEILVVLALMFTNIWAFHLPANDSETKGRIYKGLNAGERQFPYVVALELGSKTSVGVLIGREWVLTAAHCLHGKEGIYVYLGATHFGNPKVAYYVSSSSFVIHPNWNINTMAKDIALINIPDTKFCEDIFPVRLPPFNAPAKTYATKYAIIAGWGRKGNTGGRSDKLQWTRVPIVSNAKCASTYKPGTFHAENDICVGTVDGSSPCAGDSGGPLVLEDTSELIGILSIGPPDCEKGIPTIYTRITSYLFWIDSVTDISY